MTDAIDTTTASDGEATAATTRPAIPDDVSDADRAVIEARYAAPYYCPGCGRPFQYPGECTGSGEAPHAAIQTVSTDELSGDPDKFTPAPDSAG